MTPTEQILQLAQIAQKLARCMQQSSAMAEASARSAEASPQLALAQLGQLQVMLRPEVLDPEWFSDFLTIEKALLKYGKDRQANNRRAREYQKRRRLMKGDQE